MDLLKKILWWILGVASVLFLGFIAFCNYALRDMDKPTKIVKLDELNVELPSDAKIIAGYCDCSIGQGYDREAVVEMPRSELAKFIKQPGIDWYHGKEAVEWKKAMGGGEESKDPEQAKANRQWKAKREENPAVRELDREWKVSGVKNYKVGGLAGNSKTGDTRDLCFVDLDNPKIARIYLVDSS